jgi:outer membrane lipoprotein-sorting protein
VRGGPRSGGHEAGRIGATTALILTPAESPGKETPTMKRYTPVLVLTAILSIAPLALAEDLEQVEQKIISAAEKVKSCQADLTMLTTMDRPQMTMKSEGKGRFEFQLKDGKPLARTELKMVTTTTAAGQENQMESDTLSITDGEYSWVLADQMGQKMAIKRKLDEAAVGVASKAMFDALREHFNLKRLDDAKCDGRDVYVIEATPKQPGATGKQLYYYDKDTGMLLKSEVFTPDGKLLSTTKITNYKVNVPIDPKRFVFMVPDGVTVMDQTNK